ncbi:MAG: GNAT family N-acetyltransferase [Deltaproteobacteria bacterium]|jgi:ribosomal-protein-alanine N-acetyltransferase
MTELESLPRLDTERLVLRRPRDEDTVGLFAIYGDPEVMRYWSRGPMTDEDEAQQLIDDIHDYFAARPQELVEWVVARREDDFVIGTVTLASISHAHQRAEIGFAFARSEWGKGVASEAVTAVFDFAFERFGMLRIEADVDPENTRSLAMLERFGFQREGYLRERYRVGGGVQDTVMLGLLAREWAAHQSPP